MNRVLRVVLGGLLGTIFLAGPISARASQDQQDRKQRDPAKYEAWLKKEVRHQLVMLPYYSVFDNLLFEIQGDKVILGGQVVRPTLKTDAEAAVKDIEGVSQVVNNIEVLPLSPNDDRIRRAVFRVIFRDAVLQKYGVQAVPSIHIIVKNGNVALEGVVDSEMDKNVAGIRANGVSGVFSVKNNLQVVKG